MTSETAVVAGLVAILAFTSYFSQYFLSKYEKEEIGMGVWARNLGVLLFMLSVIFTSMIMYSVLLIALNAGVSYLSTPILVVGLRVIMWSSIVGIALYLFALLIFSLRWVAGFFKNYSKGRQKVGVR